jgi:hypothetical protein
VPPPASSLPTRQQLDEIDALLRRMLSLPTAHTAPVPPQQPTIRETTPPVVANGPEPAVQSWRVEWPRESVISQPPSVVAWGAPVTAVPISTMPIASAVPMAFAAPSMAAPYALPMHDPAYQPNPTATYIEQPPPSTLAPPTAPVFLPLIVLNGVFDVVSYLLPFGAWMRGSGRPILGWLGILMLCVGIGWGLGEWFGYEWPKVDWEKLLRLK